MSWVFQKLLKNSAFCVKFHEAIIIFLSISSISEFSLASSNRAKAYRSEVSLENVFTPLNFNPV